MKIKSYKDLSIAQKLLWFVLPLAIVLTLALSFTSTELAKSALQENIVGNLKNAADLKVSKIEDFYYKTKANIKMLQGLEIVSVNFPYLIDKNATQDEKYAANEKLLDVLTIFKTNYGYHNIKLLNKKGNVIVSVDGSMLGSRLGDINEQAFKNGKIGIFFSDIFREDKIYKMAVTAPVFSAGKVVGLIAIEINMNPIYKMIQGTTGLGKTGETLIAKKNGAGALFLNPLRHDPSAALDREAFPGDEAAKPILEAVSGSSFWGISKDYRGHEVIAVWRYIPCFNWGLVAKIDVEEVYIPIYKIRTVIRIIALMILLIAIYLSLKFSNYLTKPIIQLEKTIQVLGKGKSVNEVLVKSGNDEIGSMIEATNQLAVFQKNIVQFAKDIGDGNFNSKTNIDAENGELGASLVDMSKSLQTVAVEDEKRNWTTLGLAKFADLLRSKDDSLEELSDIILSNIIKYLEANQGSIFIIEGTGKNKKLHLTASYAWDRKKHQEKTIAIGDGLIGRCWQEAETIYLTDVPNNYVHITSGLGEANPTSVLIVPMKIEENVFGIIELASFKEFEKHQIEFLERLAQSIASTISNTKTTIQTEKLLKESNELTEQMQAQEEEMRQNMEELQATQEEMDKAQREMQAQHSALNNSAIVSETDLEGKITYVNDAFCRISEYTRDELIGHDYTKVKHPDMNTDVFANLDETLAAGKVWKGQVKNLAKNGDTYWVDTSITPILGTDGKLDKYIEVRFDITDQKQQEEEIKQQVEELREQEEELRQNTEELQATQEEIEKNLAETENVLRGERAKINSIISTSSDAIVVLSDAGKMEEYNPAFQDITGYTPKDLKKLSLKEIFAFEEEVMDFVAQNLENSFELEIETKAKIKIWIKIAINKMEIGNEINYSLFISDITELKHSVAVMEDGMMEFQNIMMEQSEVSEKLEAELEEVKAELEKLKG